MEHVLSAAAGSMPLILFSL